VFSFSQVDLRPFFNIDSSRQSRLFERTENAKFCIDVGTRNVVVNEERGKCSQSNIELGTAQEAGLIVKNDCALLAFEISEKSALDGQAIRVGAFGDVDASGE